MDNELKEKLPYKVYWSPVVSLQSRFATSRFAANRSRFAAHVKSFRFSEVVSLQSRFATELNSSFPKVLDR